MWKLVWNNGKPEWVEVSEQEDADRVALLMAVRNIPELKREEPICMRYADDYGPGRHAMAEFSPETSGYDFLYAELCMEKDAEKAKVRNNRKQKRKHKAEELMSEKEKRKMRNIRTFGKSDYPEDHVRYVDVTYCGGGTKAWFGREEDPTIRMRKNKEAEQFARADWKLEQENHAQTMRMIHNLEAMAGDVIDMMDEMGLVENDFMFAEFNDEINSYLGESHRLWCDEKYYRKSQSIGVNPRDYLGITRRK